MNNPVIKSSVIYKLVILVYKLYEILNDLFVIYENVLISVIYIMLIFKF